MIPYYELAYLEQVYLEDSFVLDVMIEPGAVEIRIDVVLRENHPTYVQPRPHEQHCYQRAVLRFEKVDEVSWSMPEGPPAIDASGETDYGGIDTYEIDGNVHRLVGELGELAITCHESSLQLDSE